MDDPRISSMYLASSKRWLSSLYYTVWRKNLMRSGMVTVMLLGAVLLGLGLAYRAHIQGNFHKLKIKAKIASARQDAPVPRPGGQEAIALTRTRMNDDATPEFLSATLLPGRGMNVLQITAFIPGKGEVKLLASPPAEGAESAMTGRGADADGQASLTMGGAIEAPWSGSLWAGPAKHGGQAVPAEMSDAVGTEARGGLMLAQAADTESSDALPDGGTAEAVFDARDFGGRWPSKTKVTVSAMLSRDAVELTVVAVNNGDVPEPVGIGWHPRFAILDANPGEVRLRVPAEMRVQASDRAKGQPTGKLVPVAGTAYDFSMPGGAGLGTKSLDESFVALHQGILDDGPTAELSDPANGFGLRLTALSPTIRAMRVVAPAGEGYVSIDPQYNYPDPLGREWESRVNTGMVTLQPGQSTEWKVRLELFVPAGGAHSGNRAETTR